MYILHFQDLVQAKRSAVDRDLLILKATTAQTVKCLEQCTILLRQHATYLSKTNQLNPNFGQIQYPTDTSAEAVAERSEKGSQFLPTTDGKIT